MPRYTEFMDSNMGATAKGTEDWSAYRRAWHKRLAAEEQTRTAAARAARAACERCAELLLNHFGVRQVYLFGSLTGRAAAPFGPHSDIDLAVEGLAADRYWSALAALEAVLPSNRHLDLVRTEDAHPSLLSHIVQAGEVLAG